MNIQVNLNGGNIRIIELQKKFLNLLNNPKVKKKKIKNVNIMKKQNVQKNRFILGLKKLVKYIHKMDDTISIVRNSGVTKGGGGGERELDAIPGVTVGWRMMGE